MKLPLDKVKEILALVKGKKPAVVIVSILAIIVAYYAASKGYISQDLLSPDQIVKYVSDAFGSDTAKVAIDTIAQPIVDTLN